MAEEKKDEFDVFAESPKTEEPETETEEEIDEYDYEEELVPLTEVEIVDIGYRAPQYRDKFGQIDGAALKKSYPHLSPAAAVYIDEVATNPHAAAPDANVNHI